MGNEIDHMFVYFYFFLKYYYTYYVVLYRICSLCTTQLCIFVLLTD